jgi:hypothetical protein
MAITKEDFDVYQLGSKYWAGIGDRILVPGVNDAEFWDDVLAGKGGKGFKKHLDCVENRTTLIIKYRQLHPTEPIIRSLLNEVLWKLMISGNPDLIFPNEEPEDTRPRDSQGRVMSPKALRWQQFEEWCSNPETKMYDIEAFRRKDPEFAEFYTTQNKRQLQDTPVEDAAVSQSAPTKKAVPADVLKFAQEYRTMSSQQVKTLLSAGLNPLGPAAAAENKRLFDAACACGAI